MKRVRIIMLAMLAGMCVTINGQVPQDITGEEVKTEKQKKVDISLGFGLSGGWMTSKVYTPVGDYSWKGGMGYMSELNCVFAKGYGFGVDYEHSETSYPVSYNFDSKLKLDFFLPYFIYCGPVSDKWLLKAMVGMGYSHYTDGGEGKGGFGVKTAMGIEYLLNKNLGLNLEIERRTSTFSAPEEFNSYKKNNETFGYSRLAVNLGLMVHL